MDTFENDKKGSGRLAGMRQPPRTTCKVCWSSVYVTDDTTWVTSPSPGIAHTACVEDPTAKE